MTPHRAPPKPTFSRSLNKPGVRVIDVGGSGLLPILKNVSDNTSRCFLCSLVVVGWGHVGRRRQEPAVAESPHLGRFDNEGGRSPASGVK